MTFDPIALAHEAPDEATFDRAVLDALHRSVGFDAAFLAIMGDPTTSINLDAKELDDAIAHDTYVNDLAPTKAAAVARRGVAIDTEVLGERRVRTLRYHRELAAPIGGRHSLVAVLALRGVPIGGLVLGRCGSTFSAEQISVVESLLPRLAVARASFRLPWRGRPLQRRTSTGIGRVAGWFRGEETHERLTEARPELLVRDRAGFREMVATDERGELVWSRAALDEPERSGWFYVDLLHLAAVRASNQRRFLFIGSGGGVSVRQFARVYPGAILDVVEPDERVVALARRWFGLDAIPSVTVTLDDGASFLRGAPAAAWDAIVVDAYDGSVLAPSLASRAFFADIVRALRPGGGLAFNIIGALGGDGEVQALERAARAARLDVRLVPVLDPGENYSPMALRNVVLIARRQ
jgi:spermidine synthase